MTDCQAAAALRSVSVMGPTAESARSSADLACIDTMIVTADRVEFVHNFPVGVTVVS